ncbi:MAG TPA: hypothetical protein PKD80_12545 [Microthrixaceae bacterium]|nr:hypothetical protein [Microthrixaceae bacterium]HMT26332.1 hypothetical protein [Microthrixaceae bacterium]
MRRRVGTLLLCSFLLPLAACGDDGDGDGDTASSSTSAATVDTAGDTAGDSSGSTDDPAEAPEGAADDDFCGVLIEQAAKVADFPDKIGTPEEAAALEVVSASNERILAAAPDELSDAMATINEVSELAFKVLTSDDPAASSASAEAASSPEATAAFADYRAWVSEHCGADAATILSTGG